MEHKQEHNHGCEHHGCGQEEHHPHTACGCGHDHDHNSCACGHGHDHNSCGCGHDHASGLPEWPVLLLGGGLLIAGAVFSHGGGNGLSLALCLAAWLLLGWEVLSEGLKRLFRGRALDENFLMSLAGIGAFCIGQYPEAVAIMLFYRVGEAFEHRAVARSRSRILAAVDMRPEYVNLVTPEGLRQIPAEQAGVGDRVLVRPGDRIPLDGQVVRGSSLVDTAPITGEPVPVAAAPGDRVISGCINTTGQLTVLVEKPLSESMVTRILRSVEEAAAGKPRIQRFLTRFARVYTPAVVAVAAAIALIPSLITGHWSRWIYTALTFLVMSCPCALVLSVPLAYFAGIGTAGRLGILFKSGAALEALAGVKAVVLDKTGTVTRGELRVCSVRGDREALILGAACEACSTHPIAASIRRFAREEGWQLPEPEELEELAGLGIRATVNGKRVLCGTGKLLADNAVGFPAEETGAQALIAVDGVFSGSIRLADTVKEGAEEAVRRIHARGLHTAMLTGDGELTAGEVARETGIRQVFARLLPEQKLEKLLAIRQEVGPVLFVGDGINDAPVLAGADVGAAMGSGADAAMEAADLVFLTGEPAAIPRALDLARKTGAVAKQNVGFALAVKLGVMVLGLLGFASLWLAVFADSGVAMLCVLNSVRLLREK